MREVADSIRSFRTIVESSVSHLIKEMDDMIAWTEEYISTERVEELKELSRAIKKKSSKQLQLPTPLRHIQKADYQTIIPIQMKSNLNWDNLNGDKLNFISSDIYKIYTREDPKKVDFVGKAISSYRVYASSRKDAACMNAVLQYAIIKKKISEWKLYITDFSYGYFEPYSSLTSPESTASDLTEILFFDRYFAGLFMDKMCSYLGTTHLMSYLENIDKYSRDELRKILTSEISAMGQAQIPITEEIIATKKAIDYERFGGYFLPISDFYQNLKSVFYVPCRYWAYDFESFSGHLGDAAAVDITETSRPEWVDPGYREEYMLNKDLFTPEEDAIITGTVQQNSQKSRSEECPEMTEDGQPENSASIHPDATPNLNTKLPEKDDFVLPEDFFTISKDRNLKKEYFEIENDVETHEKNNETFSELINYIASEGFIASDSRTKRLLAYVLTGRWKPDDYQYGETINWKDEEGKELCYLIKSIIVSDQGKKYTKYDKMKELFSGPDWSQITVLKDHGNNAPKKFKEALHNFYPTLCN